MIHRIAPELKIMICGYLSTNDLSSLSCCSREWWDIVKPILFQDLNIVFEHHKLCKSSELLLEVFVQDPDYCKYLRSIHVNEKTPYSACPSALKVLESCLRVVMKRSCCLTIFSWALSQETDPRTFNVVPQSVREIAVQRPLLYSHSGTLEKKFPHLLKLDRGKVRSSEDLRWIYWHIKHCSSIRSLRVHSRRFQVQNSLTILIGEEYELLSRLQDLSFEAMDVSKLRLQNIQRLERLELRRCSGTKEALTNFMIYNSTGNRLKSLSLTPLDEAFEEVQAYLAWLSQYRQLRELVLLMTGRMTLPVQSILLHAKSLKFLVLETRQIINEASTAISYSIEDLELLTHGCIHLVALGLPVQIEERQNLGRRIVRRVQSLVLHRRYWQQVQSQC